RTFFVVCPFCRFRETYIFILTKRKYGTSLYACANRTESDSCSQQNRYIKTFEGCFAVLTIFRLNTHFFASVISLRLHMEPSGSSTNPCARSKSCFRVASKKFSPRSQTREA